MRLAAAQVDAATRAVPGLLSQGTQSLRFNLRLRKCSGGRAPGADAVSAGFNQELHFGQVLGGASGAVGGYSARPSAARARTGDRQRAGQHLLRSAIR